MGLPRLGGQGGNGGDVWVVAGKSLTLKRVSDKHPRKRFTAGTGSNSRSVSTYASSKSSFHWPLTPGSSVSRVFNTFKWFS